MSKLWVIDAGKGGVGKTFFASNLGITLTKLGKSVLVVDMDLSGSNLHTSLGQPPTEKNLSLFVNNKSRLRELVLPTLIPRLHYIHGPDAAWMNSTFDLESCRNLIKECRMLPYDFVIFDLGHGLNDINLELMKNADEKILLTAPEPSSVQKTYRFLETWILSVLNDNPKLGGREKVQNFISEFRLLNSKSQFSFRHYLQSCTESSSNPFEVLNASPIKLVVNSARSQQDQDLGFSIKSVVTKYYDLNITYLGSIDFDNAAWQSLRSKQPMLLEVPFTPLAGQFQNICKELLRPEPLSSFYKAVV